LGASGAAWFAAILLDTHNFTNLPTPRAGTRIIAHLRAATAAVQHAVWLSLGVRLSMLRPAQADSARLGWAFCTNYLLFQEK